MTITVIDLAETRPTLDDLIGLVRNEAGATILYDPIFPANPFRR
jgi:hypothetical protein